MFGIGWVLTDATTTPERGFIYPPYDNSGPISIINTSKIPVLGHECGITIIFRVFSFNSSTKISDVFIASCGNIKTRVKLLGLELSFSEL